MSDQIAVTPRLRLPQVVELCGVSKKTIYQLMMKSGFPRPQRLGAGRTVVWDRAEVGAWLAAQPRTTGRFVAERSKAAA